MGIFDGFVEAAKEKLDSVTNQFTSKPTSTLDAVGGSIFEALYQYGKGNVDQAREKVAGAIMESRQGSQIVSEIEKQRLQSWMPWIIAGGIGLLGIGWMLRK